MTMFRFAPSRAETCATLAACLLALAACGQREESPGGIGEASEGASRPSLATTPHEALPPRAPGVSTPAAPTWSTMPAVAPNPSGQADAETDNAGFQPGTRTGPITQGINTDQSLPEHPVRGPTATLPEGTKQIGH